MATIPTRSAQASGLPYYVWEVPEKSISVQIFFDVIDRMYPDIMRGLGALKRRGAEVGGILIGRTDPDSGIVTVEDFEAVPSEYLTGPSYNLSENDRVSFEAAISRRLSSENGLSVVGFYRSHTRDELFMDDADLAVADRYFPDTGSVFLLIKPYASRTSIGGFFVREDDGINRQSTYLQFPFDRAELGGGAPRPLPPAARNDADRPLPPYTPTVEPQRPTQDVDSEADLRSAVSRSTVARPQLSILAAPGEAPGDVPASRWRAWMLAPVFVVVAGVAGFFGYRALSVPRVAPSNPVSVDMALPLKLSVAEKQNQLDVTWDRNANAVVQARRGVLFILDGSNKRELELSGAQMRTGRVLYSRLSGDVSLRLEVYGDGPEPVTESIRIVSTEQSPQPSADLEPVARKPRPVSPRPAAPKVAAPAPAKPPVGSVEQAPPPKAEAPPPEVELQRPARRK